MSSVENPPAFPRDHRHLGHNGMTLRDWFAGQVLASAAALPFGEGDCAHRAVVAYQQADAMLSERNKAAVKPPLEAAAPDMLEALRGILPGKLCGEGWNLPDDELVQIMVTFADLRAARAAIAAATGEV